jgi:isocitrate dehydrogenase (NAD+)
MRRITLIPGDGIGPEVSAAARAIIEASGAGVAFEEVVAGQRAEQEHGTPLPRAVFESIASTGIALKGPTQTPFGGDYRVTVERQDAQGASIKNYPSIASRYEKVDLLIFRENSEDLYVGVERMVDEGTAEAIKIISERGTERFTRFALDYMQRLGRRRLTIGHKANVMKMTDGLFLKTAQSLAKGRSNILVDERVVDALCMDLVMRPEDFDCLLLPNLYGDIVSDLAAGLVGGLGVAPGANFGADCAIFEAVHGTAPDLAGKDVANPMAEILSGVMMLRHIDETAAADRVEHALAQVLKEKQAVTPDLGGSVGTREMTAAIIEKLKS